MTIVTKTGDKGDTGLFGGQRVPKDDLRIETIGTVDELNAMLGVVIASLQTISPYPPAPFPREEKGGEVTGEKLQSWLLKTQNILFTLGADLATPKTNNKAVVPRIEQKQIDELEEWIAILEETPLPPYFILPGGSKQAAELHLARTICRRSERLAVCLSKKTDIGPHVIIYLNRLSDYLFLAAIQANKDEGVENVRVTY